MLGIPRIKCRRVTYAHSVWQIHTMETEMYKKIWGRSKKKYLYVCVYVYVNVHIKNITRLSIPTNKCVYNYVHAGDSGESVTDEHG